MRKGWIRQLRMANIVVSEEYIGLSISDAWPSWTGYCSKSTDTCIRAGLEGVGQSYTKATIQYKLP